jgi:hypothetical protein
MHISASTSNTASAGELSQRIDWQSPSLDSTVTPAVQLSTELLNGARAILSVKAELDELRSHCNQQDDLTTDTDYFLSCKHPRNCRPVVLIFRTKSRPAAAVFLHEVCFLRLGTGLCAGGDCAGEGLLIAPVREGEVLLRRAINELLNVL